MCFSRIRGRIHARISRNISVPTMYVRYERFMTHYSEAKKTMRQWVIYCVLLVITSCFMSMTLGHYRVHARKKYIYIFSLIDLLHNFGFVFTVIGPAFISSVSFLFTNYCSHKFRIHHIKFVLKVARSSLFIAVYKQLLALGQGTPDQIYYRSIRKS